MNKVLIAGPTILSKPWEVEAFRGTLRASLYRLLNNSNAGLVYAADTVTGRFVGEWAWSSSVLMFPHKAFDVPVTEGGLAMLGKAFLTADARELVEKRNEAMMAEDGISRALLFMETNECAPFIAGLRAKPINIDIIRIM